MAGPTLVYVGTYTGAKSKGIYLFRLQTGNLEVPQNITLVPLGLAAATPSPSFIELDLTRRLLFAVNELDEFEGKPTGAVSAFSIDPATGTLTLVNQRPSMGTGPCHLILDKARRHLLVANYGSGSVSVLPVGADGRLGAATDVVQHAGRSVIPQRQTGPHAHCVTLDPANRFAFVCDLGLDKVMAYRFDAQRGTLAPHDPPFAPLKPGAGPRHMVFRPDGRFAYVVNELHSTVTAFGYDAGAGVLHDVQTVSTLPEYFDGANTRRGNRRASVREVALRLESRAQQRRAVQRRCARRGRSRMSRSRARAGFTPRHFGIEPSAQHLAIANQDSNTVLLARIDAGNGRLKPSGVFANAPSPVCVKFLPPPE